MRLAMHDTMARPSGHVLDGIALALVKPAQACSNADRAYGEFQHPTH
jgi:hypothetical protein